MLLASAAVIAGCDIGDGNKIESIDIETAISSIRVDDCVGNRLTAVATFADGTRLNFTDRVTWSSDNPDIVNVTTRPTDRPANFEEDFGFITSGASAAEGASANISIEYFGLVSETPLQITTSGKLEEVGLSIHNATMGLGTANFIDAWGRSTAGERIDLTNQVTFSVDNTDAVTLDEIIPGGITAGALTTTPATLSAVYCEGVSGKEKTTTANITVVPDEPSSLIVTPSDVSLPIGTVADLQAVAVYSNGGTQPRTSSTRFTQTDPGDIPELLMVDSVGFITDVGNFRVSPILTSGSYEVVAQYVDLDGEDVAGATANIDVTLLTTVFQSPAYVLNRGADILVGTLVDLSIIGKFDVVDENSDDIGDFEQDVTEYTQLESNVEDLDKVVISNHVAVGLSPGTTDIAVSSLVDGFGIEEILTITTHDSENATINSLSVSAELLRHKHYRLRAEADITTASGVNFTQDVSLSTAWTTDDRAILHVDNSSTNLFATALGGDAGCTTITAYFNGTSGSATLNSETGEPGGCP